jgi:hypothetical protein
MHSTRFQISSGRPYICHTGACEYTKRGRVFPIGVKNGCKINDSFDRFGLASPKRAVCSESADQTITQYYGLKGLKFRGWIS